jgi:hypothetical protein
MPFRRLGWSEFIIPLPTAELLEYIVEIYVSISGALLNVVFVMWIEHNNVNGFIDYSRNA